MKILILILKTLNSLFGNERMFEAFKVIADRRSKIKLTKLDEGQKIRELKNDIKEDRLTKRRDRKRKRKKHRG